MLLFYGKEAEETVDGQVYDENVSRTARLKALRSKFYTWKKWAEFAQDKKDFQTHPFNEARNKKDGISSLSGDKSILVLNAHGSPDTFSGMSGKQVAEYLLEAGIEKAGTKEIWISACNVAKQEVDNTHPPSNLIKDMLRILKGKIPNIKIYGPRGYVTYTDKQEVAIDNQHSTLEYSNVVIRLKKGDGSKEQYDFDKGWLLAKLP